MMARDTGEYEVEVDVVVVGAGGCGLTAAIAAANEGAQVICLEKSRKPLSNTARSGGMIPAAGTRFQREAGIVETAEDFARDIFAKNHHASDQELTLHLARTSKELVEWLVDDVGVALSFVGDFKYPGHTQFRMHAPPSRTGQALIDDLREALVKHPNADLVTGAPAVGLVVDGSNAVTGVVIRQGDSESRIGAKKVILACNGYAGNPTLVARYCPGMAHALYFGGEGSTGEGVLWGEALGGELAFMDAYQGHASVAFPHGILITYAAIMEGGIQVNVRGERFGDETCGYSERALDVLAQPEGVAHEIYDARIHALASTFEDYRDAVAAGAVRKADSEDDLARLLQVDPAVLSRTLDAYRAAAKGEAKDLFGRNDCRVLEAPYYTVKVTGALFHTQGGLRVDRDGRVQRAGGGIVPNLYAGGGVAAGVSGHGAGGYLSGNGLLTALCFGMLAGRHAARSLREASDREVAERLVVREASAEAARATRDGKAVVEAQP
jgi:fumarate reductase flavoprotein subunit